MAREPTVPADRVLAALAGRAHAGVKDSFATMDLSGAGMDLLFSATWLHRPPVHAAAPGWEAVTSDTGLAEWTARHDTSEVLRPALLRRAHFRILAKRFDGRIVAGAIARLGSGTVDMSNVYTVAGHELDRAELAGEIGGWFPDRPLVGYERGDALRAASNGGFVPVGELRVWVR